MSVGAGTVTAEIAQRAPEAGGGFSPAPIPPATDGAWGYGAIHPIDREQRVALVCFSTSRPVQGATGTWHHLEMSRVNLARLKSGYAPLLVDHCRAVDYVIGVVEDAWTDADCAFARVRFARNAKATEIWELVLDKILAHVSMGANVLRQKDAPEGLCSTGPWTPYEISVVCLPADWTVDVAIGKRPQAVIESAADEAAANASGSADTWRNWAATVALPTTREDLAAAVEAEVKRLGAEARAKLLAGYVALWGPESP